MCYNYGIQIIQGDFINFKRGQRRSTTINKGFRCTTLQVKTSI